MKQLTIIIPTFNRNELLAENLRLLLPQLTPQCHLFIADNCCDTPVERTLQPLLEEFPGISVEIRRNRVNIGATPNLLRGVEECQTPFLWILGDDDPVRPDAVQIISRHLEEHPECLYFNFGCGSYAGFAGRDHTFFTKGLRQFARHVDSIANVFYLSGGVHRTEMWRANLRMAYGYAHTNQANVVPLLAGLGTEGVCCFSKEQIVTHMLPFDASQAWSFVQFSLGIMGLLELPMNPPMEPRVRRVLARKIEASLPRLKHLALQLLLMSLREEHTDSALFLYDQMCYRLYYFERSPRQRLEILLYRWMLRFPRLSYFAYKFLRGVPMDFWSTPRRFQRM